MVDTYDSPWKDVLDRYLEDFFALLFPEIHAGIDWARPPVSLEQELRKIVRDAEVGKRLADKLFRVWRKDGAEVDVMINVEVQGKSDDDFAKRMYVYNYRAFDRFDREVVSVAVLCDEGESFHPKSYTACDLWGCTVRIDFPTVKLREYNQRWDELEASANPFATVVMAHLKAQSTKRKPEERYRWKLRFVRRLYELGYIKDDVLQLFSFIDWVMDLPEELEKQLDREIQEIETERGMQYVTSIERRALKRGVEQGIQEGIQQGVQQGEARLLHRQLIRRHGALPPSVTRRLENASTEEIERWADKVLIAKTLDDVFK